MHAQTDPSSPADAVKAYTLRLAPLLQDAGLVVTARPDGLVDVQNPQDARMRQLVALRDHHGELFWCWLWPGPTRDAAPEVEAMVPAGDVDEAARRITRVLHISGAER